MNPIKHGSTDQSTTVRFVDITTGEPETGVAYNTAGIALWYRREGGLKVAITPADLAALNTAHSDGGVKHISDGYVRIDLPDAAVATGAAYVDVGGSATGMVVIGSRHPLVANVEADTFARLGAPAGASTAADIAALPTAAKIADNVLRRQTANVEASSDGDTLDEKSLYGAVAKLVHLIEIAGGTLTVKKSDGTTTLFTQTVTSDATADPITALGAAT